MLQIRQFSGAVVSTKGHFMTEAEKGKGGYVYTKTGYLMSPFNALYLLIIATYP